MLTARCAQLQDCRTAAGARVVVPSTSASGLRTATWCNEPMITGTSAARAKFAHGRWPEEVPS